MGKIFVLALLSLLTLLSVCFSSPIRPLPDANGTLPASSLSRRYDGEHCEIFLTYQMRHSRHRGWLEVDIVDPNGRRIGYKDRTYFDMKPHEKHAIPTIDVFSQLPDVFVITPMEHGRYIQFALGADLWPSDDTDRCNVTDRAWYLLTRKGFSVDCQFDC